MAIDCKLTYKAVEVTWMFKQLLTNRHGLRQGRRNLMALIITSAITCYMDLKLGIITIVYKKQPSNILTLSLYPEYRPLSEDTALLIAALTSSQYIDWNNIY
uniref:Uncharacterized protein n=1 Tax=Glossina brevipalpis TaxID=37001 RepID=A0A1A9WCH0_9MUSC